MLRYKTKKVVDYNFFYIILLSRYMVGG